jgi:hypothetical protein
MSSKTDYDAVVNRAARRGRIVDTLAAAVSAGPDRAAAIDRARDPKNARKRAANAFDASAMQRRSGK